MAGKLVIAGFVLLLVVGLVLFKFVNAGSASPSVTGKRPTVTDTGEPTTAGTAGKDEALGSAAPAAMATSKSLTSKPSISEPFSFPAGEEIQYRADGVPIAVADLDVLREAAPATDPLVKDCIAKHGGKSVTGTLITTYVAARHREKDGTFSVHTESAGFEEEGSTLTDPELVDCLVKTANEMKYPKSGSPVATWARKRIVIENGVLGENWVLLHGYIR